MGAAETERRVGESPHAATTRLPPTPKGQAMRERLIEAAAQAFSRHGFAATRVADIVALAGTSHGNFYRHFPDSSAILMAVLEQLYTTLSRATRRPPSDTPGRAEVPSEGELIRRNAAFFHLYAQHRHLLRVAREAAAMPADNGFLRYWLRLRAIFIDRNSAWLEGLKANGLLAPDIEPRLAAEAMAALTEQLAYVEVGLTETCPPPERLDALGAICGSIMHRYLFAPR